MISFTYLHVHSIHFRERDHGITNSGKCLQILKKWSINVHLARCIIGLLGSVNYLVSRLISEVHQILPLDSRGIPSIVAQSYCFSGCHVSCLTGNIGRAEVTPRVTLEGIALTVNCSIFYFHTSTTVTTDCYILR